MLRQILPNKRAIPGFVLAALLLGSALFYSWFDQWLQRQRRNEAFHSRHDALEKQQKFKPQLKNNKETRIVHNHPETPINTATDEAVGTVSISPREAEIEDVQTGSLPAVEEAPKPEVETVSETPVSPFGFGPYPSVPEWWGPQPWTYPSAEHELMARVRIKLFWEYGIKAEGSVMKNGLVYPIIPGTVYVKWGEYEGPFGVVRYIAKATGDPDTDNRLEAIEASKEKDESFTEADVPDDIKLVPYEQAGIDPYEFLNLKRR